MKRTLLFLNLVCLSLFYSCKKDTTTVDVGKNYFPFVTGSYIEYDVDSTYYNDFFIPTKAVNTKFRLKEKIQSLYYDNQNRLTARLERSVKNYDTAITYDAMSWKLKDVWVENITETTAEKIEENVRFVRLVFPVKVNKSWDMNSQNFMDAQNIAYKSVDATDNIGGMTFSSVLQTVYDDGGGILTSRSYFTEKYARNVGLVYKQKIEIQSQPDPSYNSSQLQVFYATPIMQRVTSGYQYTWTIHTYGVE